MPQHLSCCTLACTMMSVGDTGAFSFQPCPYGSILAGVDESSVLDVFSAMGD